MSGQHIIEIGAAPGGKTAQLASAGAHMQALDRSPARLTRLRQNLERLGLTAEIIKADGETWRPQELADGLLLDAPCSATGTIRRHPDIMWRRQPEDVAELAGRQARLLHAAITMIKPGGLLVYAVCSLEPAEVATEILDRRPIPVSDAERARMLQPNDLGETIRFVAEMPAHVCLNEVLISPTWNRSHMGGPDFFPGLPDK